MSDALIYIVLDLLKPMKPSSLLWPKQQYAWRYNELCWWLETNIVVCWQRPQELVRSESQIL